MFNPINCLALALCATTALALPTEPGVSYGVWTMSSPYFRCDDGKCDAGFTVASDGTGGLPKFKAICGNQGFHPGDVNYVNCQIKSNSGGSLAVKASIPLDDTPPETKVKISITAIVDDVPYSASLEDPYSEWAKVTTDKKFTLYPAQGATPIVH